MLCQAVIVDAKEPDMLVPGDFQPAIAFEQFSVRGLQAVQRALPSAPDFGLAACTIPVKGPRDIVAQDGLEAVRGRWRAVSGDPGPRRHRPLPPGRGRPFTPQDDVLALDYVFEAADCSVPRDWLHFSRAPLVLDGALQSLVWPLHADAFLRRVYEPQKALLVQGAGQRLYPGQPGKK